VTASRVIGRLAAAIGITAAATMAAAGLGAGTAVAEAPPNLSGMATVNSEPFRSPLWDDYGAFFFRVPGHGTCKFGPVQGYAGCTTVPRDAPPGTIGVNIAGDTDGPYWNWNAPWVSVTNLPSGPWVPPVLGVGQRLVIQNSSCAVLKVAVVACTSPGRGFVVSPQGHHFYFPPGDTRHD
jgi:hypothetical protein